MVWHQTSQRADEPAELIRAGFMHRQFESFQNETGMQLSLRRLRRTVVALHRRSPTQHSQDVHDSVYALPEPQVRQDAVAVISRGVESAITGAQLTVRAAVTSTAMGQTGEDTGTALCQDYDHSPWFDHARAGRRSCCAWPAPTRW